MTTQQELVKWPRPYFPQEIPTPFVSSYNIARSLRFNSADSAYLSRTPGSAPTSTKKFTISLWTKLAGLGAEVGLFSADSGAGTTETLYFTSANKLAFLTSTNSTDRSTAGVFRDPSAWLHIVCAVDSDASAGNRTRLYVNGVEQTLSGTEISLAQ